MKKTNEELIHEFVERRAQWGRIYPLDYIRKFFRPYEAELEALIELAQTHVNGHKFLGEGI